MWLSGTHSACKKEYYFFKIIMFDYNRNSSCFYLIPSRSALMRSTYRGTMQISGWYTTLTSHATGCQVCVIEKATRPLIEDQVHNYTSYLFQLMYCRSYTFTYMWLYSVHITAMVMRWDASLCATVTNISDYVWNLQ